MGYRVGDDEVLSEVRHDWARKWVWLPVATVVLSVLVVATMAATGNPFIQAMFSGPLTWALVLLGPLFRAKRFRSDALGVTPDGEATLPWGNIERVHLQVIEGAGRKLAISPFLDHYDVLLRRALLAASKRPIAPFSREIAVPAMKGTGIVVAILVAFFGVAAFLLPIVIPFAAATVLMICTLAALQIRKIELRDDALVITRWLGKTTIPWGELVLRPPFRIEAAGVFPMIMAIENVPTSELLARMAKVSGRPAEELMPETPRPASTRAVWRALALGALPVLATALATLAYDSPGRSREQFARYAAFDDAGRGVREARFEVQAGHGLDRALIDFAVRHFDSPSLERVTRSERDRYQSWQGSLIPERRATGHRALGALALAEGHAGEAIGYFEQALRDAPDDPLLKVDLASALVADHQATRALEVLDVGLCEAVPVRARALIALNDRPALRALLDTDAACLPPDLALASVVALREPGRTVIMLGTLAQRVGIELGLATGIVLLMLHRVRRIPRARSVAIGVLLGGIGVALFTFSPFAGVGRWLFASLISSALGWIVVHATTHQLQGEDERSEALTIGLAASWLPLLLWIVASLRIDAGAILLAPLLVAGTLAAPTTLGGTVRGRFAHAPDVTRGRALGMLIGVCGAIGLASPALFDRLPMLLCLAPIAPTFYALLSDRRGSHGGSARHLWLVLYAACAYIWVHADLREPILIWADLIVLGLTFTVVVHLLLSLGAAPGEPDLGSGGVRSLVEAP